MLGLVGEFGTTGYQFGQLLRGERTKHRAGWRVRSGDIREIRTVDEVEMKIAYKQGEEQAAVAPEQTPGSRSF
jgi:hypothetical protein